MNARSIPAPESESSFDDNLFSLRETLSQTQPTNIPITVSVLRAAACLLRDAELKTAVDDVDAIDSSDPLFMEKYGELLVCAGDTFSFIEMLAQVIASEIERHQTALGIEEKLTLPPVVLPGVC